MDVDVNERRVPLNQKSKLNHESISTSTWKLGNLDVNFFDWTPPYRRQKIDIEVELQLVYIEILLLLLKHSIIPVQRQGNEPKNVIKSLVD